MLFWNGRLYQVSALTEGAPSPRALDMQREFRSLRRATRALPLTRKLLKKFDQNFYIGAPAAQ